MFFPFPCGAMRTAAAPAWPVCDCVCVIALCQGQGRAAGPRLSGASAHLGKFRLNSSTFLNTQLIETLTNSNPRARPQMGREPRQREREGEGGGEGERQRRRYRKGERERERVAVEIPTVQSYVLNLLLT